MNGQFEERLRQLEETILDPENDLTIFYNEDDRTHLLREIGEIDTFAAQVVSGIDEEIKRLKARKDEFTSVREKMGEGVRRCLSAWGLDKYETDLFTFSRKNTPAALEINLEPSARFAEAVPTLVKIEYSWKKNEIKDLLKNGVEEAELFQNPELQEIFLESALTSKEKGYIR